MARIAINGFGRIGRLFFRRGEELKNCQIAAINDLGDFENLAYLLEFDSVYRRWPQAGRHLTNIQFFQEKDPTLLPWRRLKIDIVVEATGVFESFAAASVHLRAGAKRVVLSAPAKDDDGDGGKTVLAGVNDWQIKSCRISSNGSCTTNAAAVVVAVMGERPGIVKAALNTTHGYTATQNLVDGPTRSKDLRRGRAAAQNIIPSTTGATIAVTRALPALQGKFAGTAIRVPVITGSLLDLTFLSKIPTTVDEINQLFRQSAQEERWRGLLRVSENQLVSSDIIGDPHAAIVDLPLTQVIDGNLVKVYAWYDNEWGYITTLIKHVAIAAANL